MKHIFLTVLVISGLLITATVKAQERQTHELSIYGFGGYSPIAYTLDKGGDRGSGMGGGGGLGYTFNISYSFGIVTGVEISTYSSEASFANVSDNYPEKEKEELDLDEFLFSYSQNDYNEIQKVALFSIPIMAQYDLPLGNGSTSFFVSSGFKLGFPMSAKANIQSYGTATTKGYFATEKVEYNSEDYNMEPHGFVTNKQIPGANKDIDLGFSASVVLETGLRFSLTDNIRVYTGMYFDYGLNNIQKVNDKHLLEYDLDHEKTLKYYNYHSVLNTGFTNKINLMSVGLKIRVSLGL
jgi:hypothetical protein